MKTLLRRIAWWLRPHRKEDELREELQFHLDEDARERRDAGISADEARVAARRDLGNEARVREDVRAIWTWRPFDELSQDLRFAGRTLFKNRAVAAFAVLTLSLGIGANTAIYSFMDALLLRALPITDPDSLVVVSWRSKAFDRGKGDQFVLKSISGSTYRWSGGLEARIFPFAAYERIQEAGTSTLSTLFAHAPAGTLNVIINDEAEQADGQYVTGNFFSGLSVSPSAGRALGGEDDRQGAAPVAMISHGFSQRRFGSAANAVDQPIIINGTPFTIVGVTPPEFFGVDPSSAPSVFLPLQAEQLLEPDERPKYADGNYYWLEMMGRLRPGVSMAQAQAALAGPFASWVATTASNDDERANLPQLHVVEGASGLDTLRRRYSQPLYVLFAMVGLILAIACANTANLLLARATARRREIAVRLSIGAGRFRLVRQLLTESLALAAVSGALGVAVALASIRLLTMLLAGGDAAFTLDVELNWRVLAITVGLSMLCGVVFGLVPAIQATRPALVPALKDGGLQPRSRRAWLPGLGAQQALVVGQISLLMLLLVAAGLFVRTLSNLHSVFLGFNQANLLLFNVNAAQAGHPEATVTAFYDDLRARFMELPGVRAVSLSHASMVRAGRSHPVTVDGVAARDTRFMQTGPNFFTTMEIPILQGREIDGRDRAGALPVAVVSEQFVRTFLLNQNPIGRRVSIGGAIAAATPSGLVPAEFEIVGVAANARYGNLKARLLPVVYASYAQIRTSQVQQMTFALRTDGDPLRHAAAVRHIVHAADARVPVTNLVTQAAEIDRTINQEIIMARLATAFALLALVIACAGLYGTMAYSVARRTRELGIRMALGARRGTVIWMVLRDVCVLTVLGLLISVPLARGASRFVESFLFQMQPNDASTMAAAMATLAAAALLAGYGPARRASRIDPTTALRHE